MLQKAYAEGMRALVLYTASIQDAHPDRRGAGARTDEAAGGPERPAAAGGQGRRLRAVLRDAHPVPADARRLRVPAGLPDRAVHQGREDRQPVRGHHRRSRAWTCSSARSCGTTGQALGALLGQIRDFAAAEGGNGRLKAERAALAEAAGHVEAMAGAMAGFLMGSADQPERGLQGRPEHHPAADGARRPGHRLAAAAPGRHRPAQAGRDRRRPSRPRLLRGQAERGAGSSPPPCCPGWPSSARSPRRPRWT